MLRLILALSILGCSSSHSGTGDGGGGDDGGGGGGDGGGAGVCAPGALTPPATADRVTAWNPGILSDDQLHMPLGDDGLPQRTMVCATVNPGGNIQSAINSCAAGQVVQLAAGTFTVAATITLTNGVVLRGAGSQGAPTGTTIVKTGGNSVLAIGTAQDGTCYGGTAYSLTADAMKETATVTVGASASKFTAGQLALIDEVDDATVQQGDCTYFKRVTKRSTSERVEISAVDTTQGTLTLSSPLHWTFRSGGTYLAQITPVTDPTIKWAGIEDMLIQGGTNSGYDGQMAGGIDISNAAYSWVKDVQTDGTIGGMHVTLTGTYRVVVRDGYFHNSATYGFGTDCYGIVMRCGAADGLVENNIVRYMNKPILFNASGGGNVVAYNYADNSWATPPAFQEVNIDCHCSFPHMELIEGNYAPHVGATNTHGNAGYLTFFRNYSSSQFASPPVFGSSAPQTGNITAVQLSGGDINMNVIGSVLGTMGVSTTYEVYDNSSPNSIYELGDVGAGATDIATTSVLRTGNYDYVSDTTKWDPSTSSHTLPSSLYSCGAPRWWPAGTAWPWAGPDLSPMVGTLPAKDRSDHLP